MDDPLSQIADELSKAGTDAKEQELLQRLEKRRITPEKEIPPMQFLFQMFCKPCFPRGELVAVAGKAKSGKTFVSSILMSLCFRDEVLTVRRLDPEPLRVLWFDTEQSEESTQDILKNRIMPMIGIPETAENQNLFETNGEFQIFNVRADFWQDRLPMLEAAMRKFQPDLVILDGIRDLVNDINDGVMAQDVIERLMHLASDLHCCITCILHQNKSVEDKNLRGWIGTELKNKAFEVYECTKDSDRIFTWSQTDTRKYDILDKLKYTVGDDGIPQLCSVEQLIASQGTSINHKPSTINDIDGRVAINPKYLVGYDGNFPVLDITKLFPDAFRPGEIKSATALQATIMKMANITSYKFYNRRREEALAQGLIVQTNDDSNHVMYSCPSKSLENNPITPTLGPQDAFTKSFARLKEPSTINQPTQLDFFKQADSDGDMPF